MMAGHEQASSGEESGNLTASWCTSIGRGLVQPDLRLRLRRERRTPRAPGSRTRGQGSLSLRLDATKALAFGERAVQGAKPPRRRGTSPDRSSPVSYPRRSRMGPWTLNIDALDCLREVNEPPPLEFPPLDGNFAFAAANIRCSKGEIPILFCESTTAGSCGEQHAAARIASFMRLRPATPAPGRLFRQVPTSCAEPGQRGAGAGATWRARGGKG
jgi:hypothetical protein